MPLVLSQKSAQNIPSLRSHPHLPDSPRNGEDLDRAALREHTYRNHPTLLSYMVTRKLASDASGPSESANPACP